MTKYVLLAIALGAVALFAIVTLWTKVSAARRERHIRTFQLPRGLFHKLGERRPEVDPKYHALVAQALRQYFLCHLSSGMKFVSMPSKVVDDLWHEFILYTREYHAFCKAAFGGYMHHVPAAVLSHGQNDDTGLRRTWHYACREENINPAAPARVPLLFAIDGKLGVADGFRYVANCGPTVGDGVRNVHCGAELGERTAGDGVDGGDFSIGGDSGGDSGCGGGGCGGGGGD